MKNRTPTPPPPVPAFRPVPRKYRHDGWTPERQRAFIEALAETGSVTHAAARINMSTEGAYYLRRQPGAEEFREAWRAALDYGVQRLEDVALERAIHGVEVPVYSYGKLVGTRTVHNDRLLMFTLRNRAADRFSAGASGKRQMGKREAEIAALKKPSSPDDEKRKADMVEWITTYFAQRRQMAQEARERGEMKDYHYYMHQIMAMEMFVASGGDALALQVGQAMIEVCRREHLIFEARMEAIEKGETLDW